MDFVGIADKLRNNRGEINSISVVVGFDGFIDEISRVVKSRKSADSYTTFSTITEFSDFTRNAAGKSTEMEIVVEEVKLGGNAPIMANALAGFGLNVACIGAMGYPEIKEVFKNAPNRFDIKSVCDPGYCYAFEFDDGKLMFGNLKPLDDLTWDRLKSVVGLENIKSMLENSRLMAFVDWSIPINAGTIWEGISNEVLTHIANAGASKPMAFFDLADPSKRTVQDIVSALQLISSYSQYCDVTLGLNENEAMRVYNALRSVNNDTVAYNDLESIGKYIFENMNIDTLLIHPIDSCIGVTRNKVCRKQGKVIANPKISTGGGDNFNAGYCLGRIMGFDTEDSMIIGMATSGAYVRDGRSPSLDDLARYIEEW